MTSALDYESARDEAFENFANALIEVLHFIETEVSKSGHDQKCIKASVLNKHLGSKQAVTSLYIRI
jgi:hypothetical protein